MTGIAGSDKCAAGGRRATHQCFQPLAVAGLISVGSPKFNEVRCTHPKYFPAFSLRNAACGRDCINAAPAGSIVDN